MMATVQISVEFSDQVAFALRHKKTDPHAEQILSTINKYNGRLEAMHPGTSDETLLKGYLVEVEEEKAKEAADSLLHCRGVHGAYLKPEGEAPG